ncbi:MAG: hypothetical protein QOD56_3044 [Gammaproteobacteria bacterium]|jgi:hypothetical protein|nr:hypothetical protein [Gammaproteobacteria bacterium]
MATFSDETLMAFADGELDATTRAAVDAAMREDPEVAKRVAQHRALRAKLQLAYASELDEAPPKRLLAAARAAATPKLEAVAGAGSVRQSAAAAPATVSNIADARKASAARRPAAPPRWRPLLSMAASLVIGVGVGYLGLRHADSVIGHDGGTLVAKGDLADALSNQLGSDRARSAPVQIGLSFLSKSGDYCRVFTLSGAASPAGVACHHSNVWQIRALAQDGNGAAGSQPGTYRTASSGLSPLILDAVQQQMAGEPLDQSGETQARQRGWRSPR